jgi:hypothetical protein
MKFNVKNDSSRARALRAASGGMTIVPPNSENVYDLDPRAQFKSGVELFVTKATEDAAHTKPAAPQAKHAAPTPQPQPALAKVDAPKAAATQPVPPQSAPVHEEPAPWQRGLEAPK